MATKRETEMDRHKYKHLLTDLENELQTRDIESLKFLCGPVLRPKKLFENNVSGFAIFCALEERKLLGPNDLTYLVQVLNSIGRADLAYKADPTCAFDKGSAYITTRKAVDPVRTLLFLLSEKLSSHEVLQLKNLYGEVPKTINIDKGIDLFTIMLQHRKIRVPENDLSLLKQLLDVIQRKDLVAEIEKYEAQSPVCKDHLPHHRPQPLNPKPETMDIRVQTFRDSRVKTFTVLVTATVDDLLMDIKRDTCNNMPIDQMRLVYAGKNLERGVKLSRYDIKGTVLLAGRLRGGNGASSLSINFSQRHQFLLQQLQCQ